MDLINVINGVNEAKVVTLPLRRLIIIQSITESQAILSISVICFVMRNHLLYLLLVVILDAYSIQSYGQDTAVGTALSRIPEPIIILNKNVIGATAIEGLDPKNITNISVYKGQNVPDILKNLTSAGIIAITYDGQVKSTSFTKLGRQLSLHGPLRFMVNGQPLAAAQVMALRIAPEAIGQLCITPATADSRETVVSIQIVKSKPTKPAPGTIMLRGIVN